MSAAAGLHGSTDSRRESTCCTPAPRAGGHRSQLEWASMAHRQSPFWRAFSSGFAPVEADLAAISLWTVDETAGAAAFILVGSRC